MRTLALTLLILTLAAAPADAHGGQYVAPADSGSGSSAGGGVVAPPTNPGGALAATAQGAQTQSANSGRNRTGSRGTRRGQPGRDRAGAVTGSAETGPGMDSWLFWWNANRDRFLRLRDRLALRGASSSSPLHLTGKGRRDKRQGSRRPTDAQLEQVILPTLETLLSEDQADILDSSLLSLARSAPEHHADALVDRARGLLAHRELSVRSTAALALGVLGRADAADDLAALLADDSTGRRLVGGGQVASLVRAHAALSLGLLGRPESLLHAARNLPDSERNVKASALVGLGLIGADHPLARQVAADLTALLLEPRTAPIFAAQLPVALGRLGAREQLPVLVERFLDRDTDDLVRQSLALAFGQLATLGDGEVVQALQDYVAEGRDAPTRHFALVALAEMGARSDHMDHVEQHLALRDLLHRELSGKGSSQQARSWAALALALHTRAHVDLQAVAVDRLQDAYDDESDPEHKGAMAIALGLLGSRASTEALLTDLRGSGDQGLQGHLALALGLIDHGPAAEDLRRLCTDRRSGPELRLSAAMALGLLGDRTTVGLLVETLTEAATLGVAAASAKALGLIGDQAAVEGLRGVALADDKPAITRGFAAVALGLLGERGDLPWNEPIKAHGNYRAFVEALAEVHDIL